MHRHVLWGLLVFGAGLALWFGAKLGAGYWADGPDAQGLTVDGGPVAHLRHDSRTAPLEHEFRLVNPTSAPIEITGVETACSCVTAGTAAGTVGPGETFPLRIKLTAFAMDLAEERRTVRVLTSRPEPLVLELRVRLPLPEQVMYRPEAVYFYALPGEQRVTRTVGLRVPKHRGRPLTPADVTKVGCDPVSVELTEMPATDMFLEYRLTVVKDAAVVLPAGACVRVNAGSETVTIPLYHTSS